MLFESFGVVVPKTPHVSHGQEGKKGGCHVRVTGELIHTPDSPTSVFVLTGDRPVNL